MSHRMNRWARIAPVAVLGVSLAVTGCAAPGGQAAASGKATGPINIASISPQSGQFSSLGAWELKGVKLAVAEVNAAGGIKGRKLAVSVMDDQGDPTVATNLARKAVSDGAVFVFGSSMSGNTLAMAPTLAGAKIPEITSGSSPKLATTGSKFLFLNCPPSTVFDQTLANYLVGTKAYKSIAMISNNGSYGKGEHDAFLAALSAKGVKPVADQVVTPDQKDFSSALTSIGQKKPQVLFIGAEEVESGLIAKQARQLGITAIIAGGAPLGTPVYLNTAGVTVAEGTIVSTPYLGNDTDAQTIKFAAAYQKAYGQAPEFHGAKAYDGAQIVIKALQATNGAGGATLAEAIRAVKYEGLVGSFAFDQAGIGVHATTIAVITNGKQIAVK
jgi:branched-chain amino acid transport system substrate-binding protein